MQEAADLCRNLGGKMVVLEGESPHTEIADYIKSTNVSFVVMGQSTRSRFQEVVRGSIINRIMRETQNVDVMIVGDADTGANE
jgi:two-component system sensor histidine kinase KdpD